MGNKGMRRPCCGKMPDEVPHLVQRPAEHGMVGSVGGTFLPDGIQLRLELHALERGRIGILNALFSPDTPVGRCVAVRWAAATVARSP